MTTKEALNLFGARISELICDDEEFTAVLIFGFQGNSPQSLISRVATAE